MLKKIIIQLRASVPDYFLLIVPLAYLVWEAVLYTARGPNWMMVPQDLSYNYLLNGLNVLNGDPIGSLIHPALTTIGYIAAVTWTVHQLFGAGPLATAVIGNPEFYFSVSAHSITLLTAFCLYLMGRWAYQGLRDSRLVLLLQSFVLLPPPVAMVLNSYASPESMLVMLAMLQAGLTIRAIDGRLEQSAARRNYIIASVVIGSMAVATKFIAFPLLIVPFLMVPTWRSKAIYSLGLVAGIGVCLSPIALVPAHRLEFINDMGALVGSAVSESHSRGAGESLASYSVQLGPIIKSFPDYVYILILNLLFLLLLLFHRHFFRTVTRKCPWVFRIFVIAQLETAMALVFVLIRPRPHYLVPFSVYLTMGFATFIVMAGRYLETVQGFNVLHAKTTTTLFFAVLLGVIFSQNAFSPMGLTYLIDNHAAAMQMKHYSYDAPGNNAIVTAIQASNVPTALYHGYMTSNRLNSEILAAAVPRNHYDYAFDGLHASRYRAGAIALSDLQEMYDRVLFWTTLGNFGQHGQRAPIEAVWQDIRVAAVERLSELEALAIHGRFDVRLTPEQNAARGWTLSSCRNDAICLAFDADAADRKVVSHLRFLANRDQFATMPERWRLEASVNGRNWMTIENFVDHQPWTELHDIDWPPVYKRAEETSQNRVYRVNNERFYPHYRLVFPQDQVPLKAIPGQVIAYSAGGCAPEVMALPVRTILLGKDESTLPGINIISGGFWEQTGSFPKTLLSESTLLEPRRYLLGTGNDGQNGRDSWARMPRNWIVEGSKDGKRWDVLDRHESAPQWRPNETRAFPLNGTETYSRFRLVVNETSEAGVVRLYRFRIEGKLFTKQHLAQQRAIRGRSIDEFYESTAPLPITLQTELEQPTPISSYRLGVGPYGKDSIERMPKSWRLFGSEDGKTWQLADTRRDQDKWQNGERRVYKLSDPALYKYLRLEVTEVGGAGNVFRLSSISFFTPRSKPPKMTC